MALDKTPVPAISLLTMEERQNSDADLVARTLSGDREAFRGLYDRYARLVRAVVYGVARDYSTALDLTQECFLRAYRNLGRLYDAAGFGRWIVVVARQVARERRRSLRRDRHCFVGGDWPEVASSADHLQDVETAEEVEQLMRRLAGLPERERIAVCAFFFDQHDARQAADLLGVSLSGFYGILGRALRRLAALLGRREVRKGE